MILRTLLSRSNGYRELCMYDESILELEEIEGEDRRIASERLTLIYNAD